MNPIIHVLNALVQTIVALRPVLAEAMDTLSSEDKAQVEAALARLAVQYEATHADVQRKLRGE